jgi:ankyrin repeat protein
MLTAVTNTSNVTLNSQLIIAIHNNNTLETQKLIESGAKPNGCEACNKLLHHAVFMGNESIVNMLMFSFSSDIKSEINEEYSFLYGVSLTLYSLHF